MAPEQNARQEEPEQGAEEGLPSAQPAPSSPAPSLNANPDAPAVDTGTQVPVPPNDPGWPELLEAAQARTEMTAPATTQSAAPAVTEGLPPVPNSPVIDALAREILPVPEAEPAGARHRIWALAGIVVLLLGFSAGAWIALRPAPMETASAPPPLATKSGA